MAGAGVCHGRLVLMAIDSIGRSRADGSSRPDCTSSLVLSCRACPGRQPIRPECGRTAPAHIVGILAELFQSARQLPGLAVFPRNVPVPVVGQAMDGLHRVGINGGIEIYPVADEGTNAAEVAQPQQGPYLGFGLVVFQQDGSILQRFAVVQIDELAGAVRADSGDVGACHVGALPQRSVVSVIPGRPSWTGLAVRAAWRGGTGSSPQACRRPNCWPGGGHRRFWRHGRDGRASAGCRCRKPAAGSSSRPGRGLPTRRCGGPAPAAGLRSRTARISVPQVGGYGRVGLHAAGYSVGDSAVPESPVAAGRL